jgi:hypothetical protein
MITSYPESSGTREIGPFNTATRTRADVFVNVLAERVAQQVHVADCNDRTGRFTPDSEDRGCVHCFMGRLHSVAAHNKALGR